MIAETRTVRLLLLATFGLSLALPRGAMPCCQGGGMCAPTIRMALEQRSCCGHHGELPSSGDPAPAKNEPCPPGGMGCVSPCCSKAPAPAIVLPDLRLENTTTTLRIATSLAPLDPIARGIFHPPRP